MLKDKYDIPDPKDIVEQAIGNTGNLAVAIGACAMDISLGQWVGLAANVVNSLAVPVFLVQNAVEGIEDAKELSEKAEKEVVKNQLIPILSLVFMIVPFLGEAAALAAGSVQVARPRGKLKSSREFKDAVGFRRAMSGENIASLGPNFAK